MEEEEEEEEEEGKEKQREASWNCSRQSDRAKRNTARVELRRGE